MKLAMTLTGVNQEKRVVVATFADFVAYEEKNNKSVANFATDMRMSDLAWLAWHAETRTNKTTFGYEVWKEQIDELEVGGEDTRIVPLESTPGIG